MPPVEGGSEDLPEAPVLAVGASPFRGDILVLDRVAVESDAWVVVHPEAAAGGPDAGRIVGRSFVMHGTTERVPVDLDAAPTGTLYVMLHDDTGEVGRFEFGTGDLDPPLTDGGQPVVEAVVAR
ncbi:DUF7282 domain-containing protein [Rubrivirga marina]|uniref:DUF7282 domain-containing protein n=1 Tax=Rubrivirga marina TaxID=1196024 RepID=UPI003CCBD06E